MLTTTIERYLLREICLTWAAVTLVLLIIMVGNVFASSLGRASEGSLSADVLFVFVAVKSIGLLVTLVPLGLYLGILLAFGRLYRDSEMTAMTACGVSLWRIMRPAAIAGVFGVAIIAVLTIWVNPWAATYEQQIKADLQERSALDFLVAGRFIETPGGGSVYFVQKASEDKTEIENVFLHHESSNGEKQLEVAKSASYQKNPETGEEFVIFSDGQNTVGRPGESAYQITSFENHGIAIPPRDQVEPRLKTAGMSLEQLWNSEDPRRKAELQWRISIPLASLILALLAVLVSHTSPRKGRFSKIAVAILIYIPYSNLLVLARKWIADGTVDPAFGIWWVHAIVLVLFSILLIRRLGWSWIRSLLRFNAGGKAVGA